MQSLVEPAPTAVGEPSPYLRTDTDTNRDRYLNITPYENNRFELRVPGDISNNYINASPVVVQDRAGNPGDRFIATQV